MNAQSGHPPDIDMDLLFICGEVPVDRMECYVEGCLGSLLSGQSPDAEILLHTLETYVACEGRLNEMSRRLYIHRNTAAYRIEKLEKMLGMPLRPMESLLRLKLVFLFRQMLSEREQRLRISRRPSVSAIKQKPLDTKVI